MTLGGGDQMTGDCFGAHVDSEGASWREDDSERRQPTGSALLLAFRSSSGHGGPHRHLSWPSTSLDTASMSPVPFTRLRRPLASYQVANGAVCSWYARRRDSTTVTESSSRRTRPTEPQPPHVSGVGGGWCVSWWTWPHAGQLERPVIRSTIRSSGTSNEMT